MVVPLCRKGVRNLAQKGHVHGTKDACSKTLRVLHLLTAHCHFESINHLSSDGTCRQFQAMVACACFTKTFFEESRLSLWWWRIFYLFLLFFSSTLVFVLVAQAGAFFFCAICL